MSIAQGILLVAASCVAGSSDGEDDVQPLDAAKLVGQWTSVKFDGRDVGDFIVGIEAEFDKQGRVTMTAKLKQEGEVVSSTKKGTYRVVDGMLEMTVDEETQRSKAWFEDGNFVLQDPEVDFRVHFKRVEPDEKK